ncbi:regulatory protein GemA [Cereibacter changlensis]|uniref:Regulatory protein GemA n=1 Tax=Cereibacter changlensis TaxID=402884 RepID=A0A4U0YYI8_9RHOB|nr:regulatory protein GemA [Cereibacter changlensis]TKA96888.1 regulatory protein GemA [Cereibacter changlensis]
MTARALQRLIHVGCRELGLDADTRRDLQLVATGKASMAEMSEAELAKLLEALKARGFKPGFKPGAKPPRPAAPRPDLRYIHVLWGLLGKAGALKKPGREGLNAFLRTRFEGKWGSVPIDIDALRDAGQINDVTRALKDMCRRAGVET